jgi:hypothetical protein
MCIIHKGFRGFQAFLPASILGGNLIGLDPAIPYEIIHSTLATIKNKHYEKNIITDFNGKLRLSRTK